MYRKRHHWVYLHDQNSILVSDAIGRVATPGDVELVARCAQILVYERIGSVETAVVRTSVAQRRQQANDSGDAVQKTTAQPAAAMTAALALAVGHEQAAVASASAAAAKTLQQREVAAVTRPSMSRPAPTKVTKGHAAARRAGGIFRRTHLQPRRLEQRTSYYPWKCGGRSASDSDPSQSQQGGLARSSE